MVTTQRRPRQK